MPDLPSCSLAKNCLSARKLHHWAEHPWDLQAPSAPQKPDPHPPPLNKDRCTACHTSPLGM